MQGAQTAEPHSVHASGVWGAQALLPARCGVPCRAVHTEGCMQKHEWHAWHIGAHRECKLPACDDCLPNSMRASCYSSTAKTIRQPCCLRRNTAPQKAAHIEVCVIQEVDGQAEALGQDVGPQHLGMHKPRDPAAQAGHEGDVTCTSVQAAIRGCGSFTWQEQKGAHRLQQQELETSKGVGPPDKSMAGHTRSQQYGFRCAAPLQL